MDLLNSFAFFFKKGTPIASIDNIINKSALSKQPIT